MERARRDLAADKRLFGAGAISSQALEQSRTRAKTADAQYESASDAARAALAAVRAAEARADQARSPEQVEAAISDELESAVNSISGLSELRSVSYQGLSVVTAQFG
jgi:multidrug resistance efflux pump